MSDESYIVQIFPREIPGADSHQPLLVRVDLRATPEDAILTALQKLKSTEPTLVLPAEAVEEYILFPCLGDGSIDVAGTLPLESHSVLRDCNLSVPFMLALVHIGASQAKVPISEHVQQPRRTASQSQKEHRAYSNHSGNVTAVRQANVDSIQRRRMEQERAHFEACESYELLRREEAQAKKRHMEEARQAEAALELEERMKEEARERKAELQKEQDIEAHRKRMKEARDAELARLAEAQRHQEEHALAIKAAKEAAKEERRRQLQDSREQRMTESMGKLIAELEVGIAQHDAQANALLQRQTAERMAAEAHRKELEQVRRLEWSRANQAAMEREARAKKEHLQETIRMEREKALQEQRAKKEKEDERRFEEWKANRAAALEAAEDEFELTFRKKRADTRQ